MMQHRVSRTAQADAFPAVGAEVAAEIDWERRHRLMRTHTALHVLCGVIWHTWGVPVTGGNMEPLAARMDFEPDPTPENFGARVEELVNREIARDLPIEVSFLPRETAVLDADLIRTKVSLIPETLKRTTLGTRQPGDMVNLEVDVIAKYVERLVAR